MAEEAKGSAAGAAVPEHAAKSRAFADFVESDAAVLEACARYAKPLSSAALGTYLKKLAEPQSKWAFNLKPFRLADPSLYASEFTLKNMQQRPSAAARSADETQTESETLVLLRNRELQEISAAVEKSKPIDLYSIACNPLEREIRHRKKIDILKSRISESIKGFRSP